MISSLMTDLISFSKSIISTINLVSVLKVRLNTDFLFLNADFLSLNPDFLRLLILTEEIWKNSTKGTNQNLRCRTGVLSITQLTFKGTVHPKFKNTHFPSYVAQGCDRAGWKH